MCVCVCVCVCVCRDELLTIDLRTGQCSPLHTAVCGAQREAVMRVRCPGLVHDMKTALYESVQHTLPPALIRAPSNPQMVPVSSSPLTSSTASASSSAPTSASASARAQRKDGKRRRSRSTSPVPTPSSAASASSVQPTPTPALASAASAATADAASAHKRGKTSDSKQPQSSAAVSALSVSLAPETSRALRDALCGGVASAPTPITTASRLQRALKLCMCFAVVCLGFA